MVKESEKKKRIGPPLRDSQRCCRETLRSPTVSLRWWEETYGSSIVSTILSQPTFSTNLPFGGYQLNHLWGFRVLRWVLRLNHP